MIKLVAAIVILHLAGYEGQELHNGDSLAALSCSTLEGSATTCLGCYHCNDETLKKRVNVQRNLALKFANGTKEELCCIKTSDFGSRSKPSRTCGKNNPEGLPRRMRPSPRSVLEREYPWRAWVYSSNKTDPLCAATYINRNVKGLLTTASCVSGYKLSNLYVKFTKTQQSPNRVKNIVLHENYTANTAGNINDIALLTLTEKPDSRVRYICLNKQKLLFGLSCIVVSDYETSIHPIVPDLKECNSSNVNIGNHVMCTFMIKGDYVPQSGAGLYCLYELSPTPQYALHGIYQSYQTAGNVAVYTNVQEYTNWINTESDRIKKVKKS